MQAEDYLLHGKTAEWTKGVPTSVIGNSRKELSTRSGVLTTSVALA